jgi:hypothetical protein
MKALPLAYISLLAMVACTPQSSMTTTTTTPPPTPTPASYAAGSAANTTTAFDGTYSLASVQNISHAGGMLGVAGQGQVSWTPKMRQLAEVEPCP